MDADKPRLSVVAMMLTDVEGSTALWQDTPERMDLAMVAHHALVARVVDANGGWLPVDQGEGDARLAVFTTATAALEAAVGIQRGLVSEQWPAEQRLKVRMGLHVGEVLERAGNYFGEPVNRCARVRGLAVGGQVLASDAVARLAAGHLSGDLSLRDVGEHALKGLSRPERVYQVCAGGLLDEFPPIPVAGSAHNLPARMTSFIGRAEEMEDLARRIAAGERLLTLLGPGGIGKTRLAEEVLQRVATPERPVVMVDLSALTDESLVMSTIASALKVIDLGAGSLASMMRSLADRSLILLLDNCEQVLLMAEDVGLLMKACPRLQVLATSRAPLGIDGEHEYVLAPLPAAGGIDLFVDRVRNVRRSLTPEDLVAAVEICRRLDDLPLAIELAAAQTRFLPPRALLPRLPDVLSRDSASDRPSRHRTLRAAVQWSYDALPSEGALLLQRLSVFAGPVTIEAIEAVCATDAADDVYQALDTLVRHSLITVTDDLDPRFGMLVTIRTFALERLSEAGAVAAIRRRHAEHFTARPRLLAEAEGEEDAPFDVLLPDRFEYEAALSYWAEAADGAEPELQLSMDLSDLWWVGGLARLGERWLTAATDRAPGSAYWTQAAAQLLFLRCELGPPDQDALADKLEALLDHASDAEQRQINFCLSTYYGHCRMQTRRGLQMCEAALRQAVDPAFPAKSDALLRHPDYTGELTLWVALERNLDPARVDAELDAAARMFERGSFVANLLTGIRGTVLAELGRFEEAEPIINDAVQGLADFPIFSLWVSSWQLYLRLLQGRPDEVDGAIDDLLGRLTGHESLLEISMILLLKIDSRIRHGDLDGALDVFSRVDDPDVLATGWGIQLAVMGARARRLAGDARGAASLMAICAQRLPLDEARPEVIGYLYEVAATAADAMTAQAARTRAQALLDATGLVMPAFVSAT